MRRFLLLCLLVLGVQVAFAQDAQTPTAICDSAVPAQDPTTRQFAQPEQVLEAGVDYRAILCTEVGPVYVDLLETYAPLAVNSFVFLSQQGYYNNTTFHRVIQNFMAQGGDPTATGRGGPGYQYNNEFVGFLTFDRPGWMAMANAGANTNGSQFFITTVPYPDLDLQYTIFGEVLEGQENVEHIRLRDPDTDPEPGTGLNTVVIITDPASVTTTYRAPEPATREAFQPILDNLNAQLAEVLTLNAEASGIFDTDQVAANTPEELQSDYEVFLDEHHHNFRVASYFSNPTCDLDSIPFMAMGYTLDRFETAEDARAALEDEFIGKLAQANGYSESTAAGLDYPLYTQTINACDQDATQAFTLWQRGHFVVTAVITFPASHSIPAERWLVDLVGASIYEQFFSDPLRRELR
jgi:cyclophilin family peptidyl-prolyl cis-trans isomerase